VRISKPLIATAISLMWLAGAAAVVGAEEPQAIGESQPCCFENPRYSGTCQVAPGPEESCSDILAYLNNPNSVGKNYCGNTKVRGGWTSVSCDENTTAATQRICQVDMPAE
jgi:hypothetical protein